MNTQLINSLLQLIHSLSPEERAILEENLFFEDTYPSTSELITLALHNNSLNFLAEEPDLYTVDDGEPII